MHNYRTPDIHNKLPKDKFVHLYIDEDLNAVQIATRLHIDVTDVTNLRKEYELPLKGFRNKLELRLSKEEFERLYVKENKSQPQIARIFNTSVRAVTALRKNYGIEVKPRNFIPPLPKGSRLDTGHRFRIFYLDDNKLKDLYFSKRMSLQEIGKLYGVSRQSVYKLMVKRGLKIRNKSEARIHAQENNKFGFIKKINKNFFAEWSAKMAYVLGWFITDGSFSKRPLSKSYAVRINIIDKEMLERFREWLSSGHKITLLKKQRIYGWGFSNYKITEDLKKIGMLPKKTLRLKFPQVPEEYLRDFIRGVFDGDGSVYLSKVAKKQKINSSFCASSKEFLEEIEDVLVKFAGMSSNKIYKDKWREFYQLKYHHNDNVKLFHYLYDNVFEGGYLRRKYNIFLEGIRIASN